MRIAVFTDVHANLPALQAALAAIEADGCELLVHTGDAIGIGPHPAECLELLLQTPKLVPIMGNHDAWFAFGLPEPRPVWMSEGELAHQHWTHAQLAPALRAAVGAWPMAHRAIFEQVATTFVHYALEDDGHTFKPVVARPEAAELDRLFADEQAQLICYGHHHPQSDMEGRARYVNPGSLGSSARAQARYLVVEFRDGSFSLTHRAVPYDDTPLFAAFEARQVPERQLIYRIFFGGRFGGSADA